MSRRWVHGNPSADTTNLDVKTFHCDLAIAVEKAHRSRCPCCGNPMVTARRRNLQSKKRRDLKSVAHDAPHNLGGDATVWVYACRGCNSDQGPRTFRQWAGLLTLRQDPRAAMVAALADYIERYQETR